VVVLQTQGMVVKYWTLEGICKVFIKSLEDQDVTARDKI
jgi:hypothetical protein